MKDGRKLSLNSIIKKIVFSLLNVFAIISLSSCNVKFILNEKENESFNEYLEENGISILESFDVDTIEESKVIEETESETTNTEVKGEEREVQEEKKEQKGFVKKKEKQNVDRILFVGDNYPGKHGQKAYDDNGAVGLVDWFFKKQIETSDLLIGNLETCLSDNVKQEDASKKTYTFTTASKYTKMFKDLGFDVMGLANNHILDYGRDCFKDTIKNLKEADIAYIGAGENEEEANKPFIKEINGRKYAIFAATSVAPFDDWFATSDKSGVANGYSQVALRANIRKIRNEVDKIIVFMHWGKELELLSDDSQKRLGRSLIDLGVDCVVGCHQHIPQEVEYYKGKPIIYGLGNFVFGVTDREMFMAELRFTYGKDENGNDNELMQLIMYPGRSGYQRVVYISEPNDKMQQLVNLLVRSEETCLINSEGEVTPK